MKRSCEAKACVLFFLNLGNFKWNINRWIPFACFDYVNTFEMLSIACVCVYMYLCVCVAHLLCNCWISVSGLSPPLWFFIKVTFSQWFYPKCLVWCLKYHKDSIKYSLINQYQKNPLELMLFKCLFYKNAAKQFLIFWGWV